jgi:DNA polymerase sigma
MVFIPKKINSVDISDLIQRLSNHLLSTKEYVKVTPIYTASIPLIKLMVNYENYLANNQTLLNNYSKLINSDLYKNYPYDKEKEISFINIDISFPISYNSKKNKNTPFLQIEYIRNSLSKYTDADIVIRIIKRALKLTDMNNSYKGGLSSYTLFLMVISFLKNTNKNNGINNNKPKKNSYGHAFHDTVKFFSKFDFYTNIIDIENKNGEIFLKRNKRYSSPEYENIPVILDPVTGQNAGKSSFRINDVQKTIILINEELEKLRNIYDKNNDNKENSDNKEINDNLVVTLLKNVEKRFLNN